MQTPEPLDPATLRPGQIVYGEPDITEQAWNLDDEIGTGHIIIEVNGKICSVLLQGNHGEPCEKSMNAFYMFVIQVSKNYVCYATPEEAVLAALASEERYQREAEKNVHSVRRWLAARRERN
jgi:hypothetical protein